MTDLATIVLLLGSYDKETKEILDKIKEEIAEMSTYYDELIFTLLLEDVEIYRTEEDDICVEKFNGKATFIIFHKNSLKVKDVLDFDAKDEEDIINILKDRLGYKSPIKVPILEKLRILATVSSLIFVIRHKELTRCGEYIELAFLLGRGLAPHTVYMLVNKEIEVSAMLKELIDYAEIHFRVYENEDDLIETVRRIVYYKVIEESRRLSDRE